MAFQLRTFYHIVMQNTVVGNVNNLEFHIIRNLLRVFFFKHYHESWSHFSFHTSNVLFGLIEHDQWFPEHRVKWNNKTNCKYHHD